MSPDKLTSAQVERVLRRAAQLESTRQNGDEPGADGPGMSGAELVRLGQEAGLSPDAVTRALAELKRGELSDDVDGALARVMGAKRLIVSRDVPARVDLAERALRRFMRDQLMVISRHHGERIEWEKAKGLFPGLVRSLDFAQRYCFGPVEKVQTLVMGQGPNTTSITFHIDFSEARRHRLLGVGARVAVWVGLGALFGHALDFSTVGLIGSGAGAAAAAGTWINERRRFRVLQERVTQGPERFLDMLSHRRPRRVAPVPDRDAMNGEA